MRVLAYLWAFPLTCFGIVPAVLVWLFRGRAQVCDGVLELHGPLADRILRWPMLSFSALTIGHIIIARDEDCCARTRTHEHAHVRQGERWGPLFPLAYCGAGLWQLLRGKSFYWDNPFEIAARHAATQANRTQ